MDSLRAEGKCFHCHEKGHEQRNCPKKNSMKPPRSSVKSGSIRLANLDKLAKDKDRTDAFMGSMMVIGYDPITEELHCFEDIECRVHWMCEVAFVEDPLWYNEETHVDCIYDVFVDNDRIVVSNRMISEIRMFSIEDIDAPGFDIAEIFMTPKRTGLQRLSRRVGTQTPKLRPMAMARSQLVVREPQPSHRSRD